MSFPNVIATASTTAGSSASASPAVLLPSTMGATQLLVAYLRMASAGNITWPTGWTELFDEATDASDDQYSIAYKFYGGEGAGTSITCTATSSKYAAVCYSIENAGIPQVGTRNIGTTTTPDPPSFSPSLGAQDYLWLWMGSWDGEQTSPPASLPTNYTNSIGSDSGTAGATTTNCRIASARRAVNGASEDAPSWTISVAPAGWAACVVAVPPSNLFPNNAPVGFAMGLDY